MQTDNHLSCGHYKFNCLTLIVTSEVAGYSGAPADEKGQRSCRLGLCKRLMDKEECNSLP